MTQTMTVVPVNVVQGSAGITSGTVPQATYEVGGRLYTSKRHPGCHMCLATHINDIETRLMMGYAARTIWETLPDDCDLKVDRGWDYRKFSKMLSTHRSGGHMPFEAIAARIQQEQRAVTMGIDLEEVRGSIIDHLSSLDAIIQRGTEQVLAGATIKPSVTVSAIRAKAAISQAQSGAIDNETVREAFALYLEVTRQFLTEDQFRELGVALSQNPGLRALSEKVQRQRAAADADPRAVDLVLEEPDDS